MNPLAKLLFALIAIAAASAPATAQGADPGQEIQELARRIDEQLTEINRLLLESGKQNQARSQPKEMLREVTERSTSVQEHMDELIKKLTEMKNQSSSSGESEDQQQKQDQQQGAKPKPNSGKQGPRRENQNPDFVKQPQGQDGQEPGQEGQPQPKPGEQPGGQQPGDKQPGQQKPQNGKPDGGQQDPSRGENTRGNNELQPDIGPGNRGEGEQGWGDLPSYVNFLKNRGSSPKVPEKYRKYWDAYLKSKQTEGTKRN